MEIVNMVEVVVRRRGYGAFLPGCCALQAVVVKEMGVFKRRGEHL